jgi:thiamine kinase
VLRQPHDPHAPACDFRRQYHVLSRLPDSLAPAPVFYSPAWMVVEYCSGDVVNALPECPALAGLLYHLHQQPRFGWRIALRPLLERYWQQCSPRGARRGGYAGTNGCCVAASPAAAARAVTYGCPCGQHRSRRGGLRLIDWEYAGDGDVALELAAVWIEPAAHRRLAAEYARRASIDELQLWRQIQRWRPWVQLLMAGWYERRWQQTGDRQFIALADETWRQLDKK